MSSYGKSMARGMLALAFAFAVACAACFIGASAAFAATDGSASDSLTVGTADVVSTKGKYGNDSINTTGTANIRTVYRWGWIEGGNNYSTSRTVKNLDVTGDGWADKIKVVGTRYSSGSGYLKSIKVSVNGKKAMSYKNSTNRINRVVISVVTLKNKQPFLWINILDGKGNGIQRLYQYDSGTYEKVLSNKDVAAKKTSNQVITSLKPSNNKIDVTFSLATTVSGITRLKYVYAFEDGYLERASANASSLSYVTGSDGAYTKNAVTAAGTFKVYKSTKLKNVYFTVKAGKKVKLLSARMKGKKLLYKVQYGSKTGWIACPTIKKKNSKSPTTLFYETYGKVSLSNAIPTYSSTKAFTAAQLQNYSDHALFVARNEILAHHGKTFSNLELTNRFKSKSWWPAKASNLNEVELANVNLLASIERNRNSLYA